MLLEGEEASFERMEHRLRQLRGLARVKRELEDYALAKDMALQIGDVPIRLGKMFLFLGHGFEPTPRSSAESPGRFLALCAIGGVWAA
jgi:hypothetical protein